MSTSITDLDRLVSAAAEAAPVWRASSADDRARWLRAAADALDAHADELVAIADEETRLGETRLRGEVGRTTGQLRLFASVVEEGSYLEITIDDADGAATPPRPELRRMLTGVGPVAVFSASNFPFAFSVAGGDTASALAAGNPVVVKAPSGHPRLSERTAEIVAAALEAAGSPARWAADAPCSISRPGERTPSPSTASSAASIPWFSPRPPSRGAVRRSRRAWSPRSRSGSGSSAPSRVWCSSRPDPASTSSSRASFRAHPGGRC